MIKNIIFPIEFNHYTGGMLHSVTSIIKALSKKYNVYILAYEKAEILFINSDINHLTLKKQMSINIKKPIKTFRTYLSVRKIMKKFNQIDTIVFTNNVGTELIFGGFGIYPIKYRRIFISRGGDYEGKTGYCVRNCFKSVDFFVAISKRQVNVLEKNKIPKQKIMCINNGVSVDGSDEFNYKFNKNEKINISVIGYLMPEKNQELAIRILPKLLKLKYNVNLFLYGTDATGGIYENHLKKIVKDLNLKDKIHFMGFEANKYKIFSSTDIIVSTSLSEGFGRTIAEAMSFGIPCIGLIDSGGLLDIIINNQNGILINNNKNELLEAIIEIISNPDFRQSLSFNARETYKEKFTEEIMKKRYLDLVENLDECIN